MDLFLSIPVLGFFLATASPPSWSTTLNLVFFHVLWTTLVLSHPPLRVHLVGVLAVRLLLWLVPSLLTLLFDVALPSLAGPLKHGTGTGTGGQRLLLPPRDGRALGKTLLLALGNAALLLVVEGACSWLHALAFHGQPEFAVTTTLPLPWEAARQVALLLAAREFLQYYVHRFVLHGRRSSSSSSSWLSLVARLHTRYAHGRPGPAPPFSLQVMADHPLPLLLHRFVPVYVPAAVLAPLLQLLLGGGGGGGDGRRVHLLTYLLFLALCTLDETLSMSGYAVAPGILARGLTRRCAAHHASRGASDFGPYGVADWVHGTAGGGGGGGNVVDDIHAEADKHRLGERAGGKLGDGAGMLREGLEALRGKKKGKKRSARNA
ncbi:hypothetical protein V2A60_004178 [Cordyceps javanica]